VGINAPQTPPLKSTQSKRKEGVWKKRRKITNQRNVKQSDRHSWHVKTGILGMVKTGILGMGQISPPHV